MRTKITKLLLKFTLSDPTFVRIEITKLLLKYILFDTFIFVEIFLLVRTKITKKIARKVHFVRSKFRGELTPFFSPQIQTHATTIREIYIFPLLNAHQERRDEKRRICRYTCETDKLGQCWHAVQSTGCVTGFAVGKTRDDTDREL